MSFPFAVVLCVFGVLCLTPMALYLTWLGALNRRSFPTAIGGRLDFTALIGGLSGFLLFGGGLLVAAFQSNARLALRWNEKQFLAAFEQERLAWALVAGGYLLFVAIVVSLGMLARARSLAIYNVSQDQMEEAVTGALADAATTATRFGDAWTANGLAVIEARCFHGLRHATVRLLTGDTRLAEELERGLRKRLAQSPSEHNPAAGWMLSLSMACLLTMTGCLGLIAYYLYLVR